MNQAASARPKGVTCETHGPNCKQVASLWLLAAHEILRTIGYHKATAPDRGYVLYVDTRGALFAVRNDDPPSGAVLVCSLKPGMDQVTVAARLRHTASRWRLDSVTHQDDD